MPIISREILAHPDFSEGFEERLIAELEAAMDEELENEDADFDFIDACASAINAIRNGDDTELFSLMTYEKLSKKIGAGRNRSRAVVAAAVCALIAITGFAGALIKTDENTTVIQYVSQKLNSIFEKSITSPEDIAVESTAPDKSDGNNEKENSTVPAAVITGIKVITGRDFKDEYNVGESFDKTGLSVIAEYSDSSTADTEFTLTIPKDFAEKSGYEKIKISAAGFENEIEVRITDAPETPKLNSIYAVFPDGYSFRQENPDSPDLSGIEVFAVYSSGEERKLSPGEYTVEKEFIDNSAGDKVTVTFVYEGVSCSFVVTQAKEVS